MSDKPTPIPLADPNASPIPIPLGEAASPKPLPKAETYVDRDANLEFIRAENEDDDGYDPWSDRLPETEPLFSANPWD